MTDIFETAHELGKALRDSEAWKALRETRTNPACSAEQGLAAQEAWDDLAGCVRQIIGLYVDIEPARSCTSCGGCPVRKAGDRL